MNLLCPLKFYHKLNMHFSYGCKGTDEKIHDYLKQEENENVLIFF